MKPRDFETLHRRYFNRLVAAMLGLTRDRQEAEDVAANAFAIALRCHRQFRGDSSAYTWIYRIAVNEALNRKRRRREASYDAMPETDCEVWTEPDQLQRTLERSECCARMKLVLRQLPVKYRHVLIARFMRGMSTAGIAKEEGIPFGTVHSRMFKAKHLLRQAWSSVS